MELAVNFSYPAARLVQEGRIRVDRFKCPAWPDLVASVQKEHPVYVHFPLKVGLGIADAIDVETNLPADWDKVDALLAQTGTPLVNLHLAPGSKDYPDVPADTTHRLHVAMVTEHLVRDVRAVVERYGPERVVVENCFGDGGWILRPATLPEVIGRVVEETGCNLLLDLAHARLAARELGVDPRDYIARLPTRRSREIHVAGIQVLEAKHLEGLEEDESLRSMIGHPIDHLPLTGEDWRFLAWATERIRGGAWGHPGIVTLEYGGVGGFFAATSDPRVLAEQVPRLQALLAPAAPARVVHSSRHADPPRTRRARGSRRRRSKRTARRRRAHIRRVRRIRLAPTRHAV
jgi:uncharacterized protein (UPF0276 family)